MVQINWTFQAKDDLRNIAEFISRDSVPYAKLQVVKIKNRTNNLKLYNRLGRIVLEIGNEKSTN